MKAYICKDSPPGMAYTHPCAVTPRWWNPLTWGARCYFCGGLYRKHRSINVDWS